MNSVTSQGASYEQKPAQRSCAASEKLRKSSELLKAGYPDLEEMLRALSDWSAELRQLQNAQRR